MTSANSVPQRGNTWQDGPLAVAREYHAAGLPPVPIRQGRPLAPWRPFIERYPSWDEIERLPWGRADGVGLVLGHPCPAGGAWWVLDIEPEHVAEASAWLDQAAPGWRAALVTTSQRGGIHVYFRAPRPAPTRRCAWGDVKAVGGLIFAPPTKRFKQAAIQDYHWASAPPLPRFGEEAPRRALALDPSVVPGAAAQAGGTAAPAAPATANGHQPLDVARVLAGVPQGQRNAMLFRLACWLRGADVPIEPALRIVSEAAMNSSPPWGSRADDNESVEALVRRVYQRYPPGFGTTRSRYSSDFGWSENGSTFNAFNSVKLLSATAGGAGGAGGPGQGRGDGGGGGGPALVPVTFTGRPVPPPRPWLVDAWIPAGAVAMVYGSAATAKSLLALALAISRAAGRPFLDQPVRPGPALILDFELDQEEQHRRAAAIARGMGLPDVPPGVVYLGAGEVGATLADVADALARWWADHPDGLMLLDSVGSAVAGDMLDARYVVGLFRGLRQLLPPTGGVLMVDHQAKVLAGEDYSSKTPYGSVYKQNLARVVWQAEAVDRRPGEVWVLLRAVKNSFGPLPGETGARIGFLTLGAGDSERSGREVIVVEPAPPTAEALLARASLETRVRAELADAPAGLTARELAERLDAPLGSVRTTLSRLRQKGVALHRPGALGGGAEGLWALA